MNDIKMNYKEIWNTRLKECIQKAGYTSQAEFAKAFNQYYSHQKTKCTQKDVSRWTNVGKRIDVVINKNPLEKRTSEIGFPSYTNMKYLADFFNVSVGYLTGETDYESFSTEQVCNYLGLSSNAVTSLKKATSKNHAFSITGGLYYEDSKYILNKLLSSKEFYYFIHSLKDLDEVYSGPNEIKKIWSNLENKLGKELFNEAMEHIHDMEEELNHIQNPKIINAINSINDAIDYCQAKDIENEYDTDVFRYRLQLAYNSLVESLFPRNS